MNTFWPGTRIPRSTDNGFNLDARRARGPSIFYTPTRTHAEAGGMGGAKSASLVPTVKGLSARAQAELNSTGKCITLGKSSVDTARRISKASI